MTYNWSVRTILCKFYTAYVITNGFWHYDNLLGLSIRRFKIGQVSMYSVPIRVASPTLLRKNCAVLDHASYLPWYQHANVHGNIIMANHISQNCAVAAR